MASMVKECEWLCWWLICSSVVLIWSVKGKPQVPCYFIFGDSYYDVGNNNFIPTTLAKANFPPYGIDFPRSRPTGRFSDGLNQADVIAQHMGFPKSSPTYSLAVGRQILKGVNYASGGSGILNETGKVVVRVTTFNEQIQNHKRIVERITRIMKRNRRAALNYLSKCLYTANFGTNDFILNYFVSNNWTLQEFTKRLLQHYSKKLTLLYHEYGARKFGIIGVNRLGCLPYSIVNFGNGSSSWSCVAKVNHAAQLFNGGLKTTITHLNSNLSGANFTFINSYGILDPSDYKVSNATCCIATVNLCTPNQPPCVNRNDYIYWDLIHSTQFANLVFGKRAYKAKLRTDAYPLDLYSLIQVA